MEKLKDDFFALRVEYYMRDDDDALRKEIEEEFKFDKERKCQKSRSANAI